jgi:cell division septum initiation protein DivIVA
MSSASERYNQLLKENVDLKRKIDGLEAEKDKQRK